MPKPATGLYTRTGSTIFQWRIRVPKDLAHLYPGKDWAHRRSLGTSSRIEAHRLATTLYAQWLTTFDQQRQQAKYEPGQTLTPDLIKFMADSFQHDALTADHNVRTKGTWTKDARMQGMPKELATELDAFYKKRHLEYSRALATSNIGLALPALKEEANKLGIHVNEDTPGLEDALTALLQAMKASVDAGIERNKGNLAPTPPAPKEAGKTYKLRDVFEMWKSADGQKVTSDAIRARELALELFEEFTNNTPITQVTRLQGNEFKAWLQTKGSASKTVFDRLTYVKALFSYAHQELELIDRHPWAGITIEYVTETPRDVWTPAQINAFFAHPLYTSYALPQRQKGAGADAGYWIPLLGLFHGARVAELCQLDVADIVQVEGIWVMDINTNDGKTVKNEASIRQTPIHSELIRLGFLDYAETIRKAGHKRLWPTLTLRPTKPSHVFSKWFNGKARVANPAIEIPDFHSLRHTVTTALSTTAVPPHCQERITGHATTGSTRVRVYTHTPMKQLKEGVEAIRYEGFHLPRSYNP